MTNVNFDNLRTIHIVLQCSVINFLNFVNVRIMYTKKVCTAQTKLTEQYKCLIRIYWLVNRLFRCTNGHDLLHTLYMLTRTVFAY